MTVILNVHGSGVSVLSVGRDLVTDKTVRQTWLFYRYRSDNVNQRRQRFKTYTIIRCYLLKTSSDDQRAEIAHQMCPREYSQVGAVFLRHKLILLTLRITILCVYIQSFLFFLLLILLSLFISFLLFFFCRSSFLVSLCYRLVK